MAQYRVQVAFEFDAVLSDPPENESSFNFLNRCAEAIRPMFFMFCTVLLERIFKKQIRFDPIEICRCGFRDTVSGFIRLNGEFFCPKCNLKLQPDVKGRQTFGDEILEERE